MNNGGVRYLDDKPKKTHGSGKRRTVEVPDTILDSVARGLLARREAARQCGCSAQTISDRLQEYTPAPQPIDTRTARQRIRERQLQQEIE